MRLLLAFVAALTLSACHGCATVPTGDGGTPTPVQAFGHCTTQALTTASEGILGDVTTALATGDYENAAVQLATKYGAAEVGCAIDLVISEFTAKASRSDDAQVGVVLAHAQAFRKDYP